MEKVFQFSILALSGISKIFNKFSSTSQINSSCFEFHSNSLSCDIFLCKYEKQFMEHYLHFNYTLSHRSSLTFCQSRNSSLIRLVDCVYLPDSHSKRLYLKVHDSQAESGCQHRCVLHPDKFQFLHAEQLREIFVHRI